MNKHLKSTAILKHGCAPFKGRLKVMCAGRAVYDMIREMLQGEAERGVTDATPSNACASCR